jgi:alpha-tubulin suppressor-like RCC1 family protein
VTSRDDTGSTNTSVNLTEVSRPWFSYPNALFTMGQDQQQLAPVVRGGSGTKDFSVSGTLPDGVTFDRVTGTFTGPAPSAWNFRATQITAGSSHTCALTTSGGVKCWGSGFDGQLGNGATSDQSTPVDVLAAGENPGGTALSGITQIAAGAQHTCALTTSGGVQCWGYGFRGQLGNGARSDQSTPVDVLATGGSGNLSGVAQITAGGFHTCALTTSGGVKCWGGGTSGQLGNRATPTEQSTPVNVVAAGGSGTLSDVTQITGGLTHTCALTTTRGVKCWGRGADGQLGNGATSGHSTPVDVVASGGFGTLSNATQITAGDSHTCALTTTRGVKCWGYGDDGQLGNGATSNQSTPVDVATYVGNGLLSGVAQITAGGYHTCALATSGGVKCWGRGTNGQLGNDATPNPQSTPVDVVAAGGGGALSDGNQITAGFLHTCALTTSGGVQCWGRGAVGQLGNGANPTTRTTPVDVTRSGEQPGFPAVLSVTVTDDTGSWTLGRVVLGTQ